MHERGQDVGPASGLQKRRDRTQQHVAILAIGEPLCAVRHWDCLFTATDQVVGAGRNDVANATARVLDIPGIARNDVNMHMLHRLSRRAAGVEPDVVAVRMVLLIELALDGIDQRHHRLLLGRRSGKVVRYHSPRDHQRMTQRDREAIADGKGQLIAGYPLLSRNVRKY